MDALSGFNSCGSVLVSQNTKVGNNPIPVPDGTTSVNAALLLDQNLERKELILQNVGTQIIYIGLGFPPSVTNYSIALLPCVVAHDGSGGIFISDAWLGSTYAIGAAAGGLLALTEEV